MSQDVYNSRILIVDDTLKNIQVLGTILKKQGYQINAAQNGLQALQLVDKVTPDLILLDVLMPELDGFETCKRLKSSPKSREIPVIFLSAKVEIEDVIKGFDLGAVDYITKPFNATELLVRVKSHLSLRLLQKTLEQQNAALVHELRVTQELFKEASSRLDGILLGDSEAIREIRDAIFRYAKTDSPLFLVGPPGSGDEAIARAIHRVSARTKQAFIYVNCIQIQAEQLSGVFALDKNGCEETGKFQLANNGTLFLDSVHELSPDLQQQLFSTLQEMEQQKQQNNLCSPNVRVIVYAPYDLKKDVGSSRFHSGLYEILTKEILCIPSLLQRKEDIPVIVQFFVKQYARKVGKSIEAISENSLKRLNNYSWPGNVRELQNVLERAIIVNDSNTLEISEDFFYEGLQVDRYRLIEKLGAGGMGEVWRAEHKLLARPSAIKLMRAEVFGNENKRQIALKRFRREAEATANLSSPNTVKLYDYGISDNGTCYYVMELLHGMDLGTLVNNYGALSISRAIMILKQACRSLIEAHGVGLIHRDIKPQNLFVCKLGAEYDFLKILDFGIVKYSDEKLNTKLTLATEFIGSPMFTAPEIILEDSGGDHRADIYSLGCVAYWIITGKFVCKAKKVSQVVKHHLTASIDPPSSLVNFFVPKELDEAIMASLEREPNNRPSSAYKLWKILEEVSLENPWTQEHSEQWWFQNVPEVAKINSPNNTDDFPTLLNQRPIN